MAKRLDPQREALALDALKMLADPTRLNILHVLSDESHSVGDLAAILGVPPSAVSQHLAKLRLSGMVVSRRQGNRLFYTAATTHVGKLIQEILFHTNHLVSTNRYIATPDSEKGQGTGDAQETA